MVKDQCNLAGLVGLVRNIRPSSLPSVQNRWDGKGDEFTGKAGVHKMRRGHRGVWGERVPADGFSCFLCVSSICSSVRGTQTCWRIIQPAVAKRKKISSWACTAAQVTPGFRSQNPSRLNANIIKSCGWHMITKYIVTTMLLPGFQIYSSFSSLDQASHLGESRASIFCCCLCPVGRPIHSSWPADLWGRTWLSLESYI